MFGDQTIAALRACVPGPSRTAPTRIGASIAVRGRGDRGGRIGIARVVADQRVDVARVLRPDHQVRLRSPCRRRPAAASASVARTWLSSTARRCALNSRPEPRHVALDDRDVERSCRSGVLVGTAKPTTKTATAPASASSRPRAGPPARRSSRPAAEREQATGGRDHERDQRRATERPAYRSVGASLWLNASRAPREAAERRTVAQRLLPHPQHPGDQRPRPAPAVHQRASRRPTRPRAARGRRPPGRPAAARPAVRRRCASRSAAVRTGPAPAQRAEPEAGPQAAAVDRDGEQRHADRRQPPLIRNRERGEQGTAAGERRDRSPTRCRSAARGRHPHRLGHGSAGPLSVGSLSTAVIGWLDTDLLCRIALRFGKPTSLLLPDRYGHRQSLFGLVHPSAALPTGTASAAGSCRRAGPLCRCRERLVYGFRV